MALFTLQMLVLWFLSSLLILFYCLDYLLNIMELYLIKLFQFKQWKITFCMLLVGSHALIVSLVFVFQLTSVVWEGWFAFLCGVIRLSHRSWFTSKRWNSAQKNIEQVHHIILTIDFELKGMGNVCFHCDIIRLVASGQKLYMQGMFEFRFILFFYIITVNTLLYVINVNTNYFSIIWQLVMKLLRLWSEITDC